MIFSNGEVDIFVGSKIGSFKHIKFFQELTKNNKKCIENLQDIKSLTKEDCITCMVWVDKEQNQLLLARKNQQVQIYDTEKGCYINSFYSDCAKGEVIGLGKHNGSILTALTSGTVKLWNEDTKEKEYKVDTGGPLDCMRVLDEDTSIFATGGKENDLKVYKIGETVPTFQAKNLPHDWLQLRPPVWVSSLCFLPGSGGNLLAVCSKYAYVRLYDTRTQRRPVSNIKTTELAPLCIVPGFDERQVLVGFGRGEMRQIDLRANRPDKGYKGSVGAVTDIAPVPSMNCIVSVSLDRHLKVHDAATKKLISKQYLTSKLSSVLVQTNRRTPLKKAVVCEGIEERTRDVEAAIKIDSDEEMDAIFDSMETVSDKIKPTEETTLQVVVKSKKQKKTKKRSVEQTEDAEKETEEVDDKIAKLLKSTEKKKRKLEKTKKLKKSKSVFHNA